MRIVKISALAMLSMVVFGSGAYAQRQTIPSVLPMAAPQQLTLDIAANSSSGTYSVMLAQIQKVCSSDMPDVGGNLLVTENKTIKGGAVGNLEAIKGNTVYAGFLHSDVWEASRGGDADYNNLKTLVALYPEDVHVLALRTSKLTTGGIWGVGATARVFNSLADFTGLPVGAAGGGVKTMQVLSLTGGAGFIPVDLKDGGAVIPALRKGEIHAAIFVGGAPLDNITALSSDEFKLLPIGDTMASRVSTYYRPTRITYNNLQAAQIPTIAPMATIMTRQLNTQKFKDTQIAFRKCFFDKLDEIKETPGFHPKWQLVKAWDRGIAPWLDLPGDQPAPTK